MELLDRDGPPLGIEGEEDPAHAAGREMRLEPVPADRLRRFLVTHYRAPRPGARLRHGAPKIRADAKVAASHRLLWRATARIEADPAHYAQAREATSGDFGPVEVSA
ncbi:hypothetical protein GCM10010116_28600 [Microbispora rosea subsp. aerata]|nr:hypothetical protein GCM10010116_28600 [Microbispora rosea subsp. aerata]GIH53867.1 hypothetical protein Mro02_07810 [Microbispora rosea subsp. aerata]GLJ84839.1 hypothetical protein GCM10017588_35670 [Microbispora rosea subsp. aerata]